MRHLDEIQLAWLERDIDVLTAHALLVDDVSQCSWCLDTHAVTEPCRPLDDNQLGTIASTGDIPPSPDDDAGVTPTAVGVTPPQTGPDAVAAAGPGDGPGMSPSLQHPRSRTGEPI